MNLFPRSLTEPENYASVWKFFLQINANAEGNANLNAEDKHSH